MARLLSAALASLVLAAPTMDTSRDAPSAFPARLETYLTTTVRLTAEERKRLSAGAPVTKLLDADDSNEVAVFGAIWINGSIRRYADLTKDIENFEHGGGFRVTKRISAPPMLGDFSGLHLPEDDVADLRTCRVGACKVKLNEKALERFRTEIDWKAPNPGPAVDSLMRQLAFEYVTGYLEGGDERLAVYRDKSRPTSVARELRAMIDQTPQLTTDMPDLRRYLLQYPKTSLPDSTSFLYWQETDFGLKPTIRISHLTIREGPDDTVVASKMLYATHYFWTGLELRVLLPDPSRGPGFWFVTDYRGRSDGLSGFTGLFVRGRVRSEVQNRALAGLRMTKQMLEEIR